LNFVLDAEKNSYGSPGIYFKYDWSALKIAVHANRDSLLQLVIRLCSIIAGIIVISSKCAKVKILIRCTDLILIIRYVEFVFIAFDKIFAQADCTSIL